MVTSQAGTLSYPVDGSGTITVTQSSGGGGDQIPPAPVTSLAAGSATQTSVSLTWIATGDDGSAGTAARYDLRRSTSPITEANWAGATLVPGLPSPRPAGWPESFTVSGLSMGTTYYFALKVADEVPNWSGLSNVASGRTLDAADTTPPAAVTDLRAAGATQTSVSLAWTATGDDGSSGTATTYDLRRSTSPITAANWTSATPVPNLPAPRPAGTPESFTVSGLASGTTWYFALKVADEVPNWSGLSNVASGTTQPSDTTPPAAVSDLTPGTPGPTSVTFTWTATGDDWNSGTATRYDLRRSAAPITEQNWGSAVPISGLPAPHPAGTTETFTVSGLSSSTTYYFALKVADEVPNWSALSNVAMVTTAHPGDTTPPAAVTDLSARKNGASALYVSWTATGDDGSVGTASHYNLRYSLDRITEANFQEATAVPDMPAPHPAGTSETVLVGSLSPHTSYYFALKVADEAMNWSALSNVASGRTQGGHDFAPPSPVLDLAAVGSTETSLTVAWTTPADSISPDAEGPSKVAAWEMRIAAGSLDSTSWTQADPVSLPATKEPGTEMTTTIVGLAPGTDYQIAIRTEDEAGNWSELSNVVKASTRRPAASPDEDLTPLLAPATLEARRSGSGVILDWTASPSPDVTGYRLLRRRLDQSVPLVLADSVVATSWKDETARPEIAYAYQVLARDATGNLSSPSPEATTAAPTPVDSVGTAPGRFSVQIDQVSIEPPRDGSPVRLHWSARVSAGSPALAGFRIYRETLSTETLPQITVYRPRPLSSDPTVAPAAGSHLVPLTPAANAIPDSLRGQGDHIYTEGANLPPGIYQYWIQAVSFSGDAIWLDPQTVVIEGVLQGVRVWPNPTAGPLSVEYTLDHDAMVEGAIFDLSGRRLGGFRDEKPAGESVWEIPDLRGEFGRDLPAGVYFIRLNLGGRLACARMVLR